MKETTVQLKLLNKNIKKLIDTLTPPIVREHD
jgi:hypothetical protein